MILKVIILYNNIENRSSIEYYDSTKRHVTSTIVKLFQLLKEYNWQTGENLVSEFFDNKSIDYYNTASTTETAWLKCDFKDGEWNGLKKDVLENELQKLIDNL